MTTAWALKESITQQGRVLHALLLREIRTRYGHRRIGYAWAIVEPALHISVLYGMRSLLGGFAPANIPLLLWLITGIVPFLMFRNIVVRVSAAARGNQDALVLPPVRLMDVVWARMLFEMATYVMLLVTLLLLYHSIVGPVPVAEPLVVLGCLVLLALSGLGAGLVAMTLTSLFPSIQTLIKGLLRVLYFASGVIFAVSRVHPDIRAYLTWNPLLHVFESLHAAFFIDYQPLPFSTDLGYALTCCLIILLLGILLMQRFARQIMEP